ncbi:MAG TPA: sulfotransferase domain-containing protein, partial [Rhodospirillales bacterium]|nr:sulfotransferase domain-containing protein [Rhodospirillales bacterium]
WGAGWAPKAVADCTQVWKRDVGAGRRIATLTTNYREVFYERMHVDGARELAGVLDWLGLPASAKEAGDYIGMCTIGDLRQGGVAAPWDLTLEPEAFYRRGKVDSWREELTGVEIAVIERLARKEMAELGYEPVAGPRDRALAKARLKAYRLANRAADAARAGADRLKP